MQTRFEPGSTIEARAVDLAGNESPATAPLMVTVSCGGATSEGPEDPEDSAPSEASACSFLPAGTDPARATVALAALALAIARRRGRRMFRAR